MQIHKILLQPPHATDTLFHLTLFKEAKCIFTREGVLLPAAIATIHSVSFKISANVST
jgi:hypothetical protein